MTRDAAVSAVNAQSNNTGLQSPIALPSEISRLERLTPAQFAVLERVAQRRTSKEIARELGISPVTVDQRLKRAQAVLGVNNRSEAARILIAAKEIGRNANTNLYGKTIYDSSGLLGKSTVGEQSPSAGEWTLPADGDVEQLKQVQAQYFFGATSEASTHSLEVVLEGIRRPDRLTPATKTIIIIAIMLLTVTVFAILVSLAEGLSRMI